MLQKLEIHHLRTLDALFKLNNISLAAEYLNVSQQAVSLQLKKLREILHDPLFVRTGHGVSPSPYAKTIEAQVATILANINALPLPKEFEPQELKRTIKISATDYTQKLLVAPMISALRRKAPNVKVIISNIEAANLVKKMSQGEIDLAFTSYGYVPNGLLTRSLMVENYRCVSATKTIKNKKTLSLADLTKHDFVVVTPGTPSFKGSADAWFEQQGYPRNVALSVPSFYSALEILKETNLVGFVPSRLLPCKGLRDIPLEKYPPGYEVVAAWHPYNAGNTFLHWLLDEIFQPIVEQL